MKINRLLSLNQSGQSLLEIAVSLGLVSLIVTILTITTLNGLKNSQFAKNQILASSYAQQGVELVKVMRQKDCLVVLTATTNTYKWFNITPPIGSIWSANESAFDQNAAIPSYFVANPSANPCEIRQNNLGESLENGQFTRLTRLERVSVGVIRVTVTVSWSDLSGTHEAKNVSLVTNY